MCGGMQDLSCGISAEDGAGTQESPPPFPVQAAVGPRSPQPSLENAGDEQTESMG